MKKTIKRIILIVLLVAVAFFYAYVDKQSLIYDKTIDTSQYMNTGIILGESISQTFHSEEDTISGISIKCKINGEVKNVILHYKLIDISTGKETSGEISTEKMKDNRFFTIRFPKLSGCEGKKYRFECFQTGVNENNGVSFYFEKREEPNTQLRIRENITQGTLICRTITHRFDRETFIVFLSFAVYIAIFMKALYKLFR